MNGDTAFTNEQTKGGWNVSWQGAGEWTEIGFTTKYSITKGETYVVKAKLRVNSLVTAAITNMYLDSGVVSGGGNNCGFDLTNAWTYNEAEGVYVLEKSFTATNDTDFVLRLACNYHGEYSFDVELFDVVLAQPPFVSVADNTLVGKITEDGAQYSMAKEGGWATCTATTRFSLTEGKRYTVSFLVSEISDASKIGNIYFSSTLGKIDNTCITTGTKNENGGYVCSVTFTVESSGVLDWRFAVNTKAAGLTFTISDFTVTEAAEA